MVFTKNATKGHSVMVETKKLAGGDTCCGTPCLPRVKHCLMFILVIINTIMIAFILCNQTRMESAKVGGRANYNMVQQIYKSATFKAQQKQQIEQALQMYQGGGTQQTPTTTTTTQTPTTQTPTVTPVAQ